jgi:GNAT superfamily N-acetyltransferase
LFEGRGQFGAYDENHPDDRLAQNHALLLIEQGKPRGALRLDLAGDGSAIVRTVAIETGEQRRGLGRSMMILAETYATAHGVKFLEMNSAPDAVAFYLRLGWRMIDPGRPTPLLCKELGA